MTDIHAPLSRDEFTHVGKDLAASEAIARPSITYWRDAWLRLKKNRVAFISLIIIALYIFCAIIFPEISPYDHFSNNSSAIDRKSVV